MVIRHGENGFLATKDDEWVSYLSKLIREPGLRQRLGTAGKRMAENDYSYEKTSRKLFRIFQMCLEENHKSKGMEPKVLRAE